MTRRPRRQWRFRLRLIELALLTASGHKKAENGGIYETQKKTARMENTAESREVFHWKNEGKNSFTVLKVELQSTDALNNRFSIFLRLRAATTYFFV